MNKNQEENTVPCVDSAQSATLRDYPSHEGCFPYEPIPATAETCEFTVGENVGNCAGSSTVEHLLPKQNVAGSNPVPRYRFDAVKHVHLLDGRPLCGTSTICSEGLPKPGLIWWGAELAAVTCLESGEHIPTIREEYEALSKLTGKDKKNARDRLQRKYPIFKKARYAHREKKEAAAGPGTDMHAELETYIKNCLYTGDGRPSLPQPDCCAAEKVFAEWALDNVSKFLWSEAHCYSERLWTGGICDCGAVLKGGGLAVIDFKSATEAYPGHFIQVGGYALQIKENGLFNADGSALSSAIRQVEARALIVFPFGGNGEPEIRRNVGDFKEDFKAAARISKRMKEESKW